MDPSHVRLSETLNQIQKEKKERQASQYEQHEQHTEAVPARGDVLEDSAIAKRSAYHLAENRNDRKLLEAKQESTLLEFDKTRDHMMGTYERREREATAAFNLVEEEQHCDMENMLERLNEHVGELETCLVAGRSAALKRLSREKDRNETDRLMYDAEMTKLSVRYMHDKQLFDEASDRADVRYLTRVAEEGEDAMTLSKKRELEAENRINTLNVRHDTDVEHERQMNVLIRTICHEIRNPLQGIISNAEYIYRELASDKDDFEYLRRSISDILTCAIYQSQVLNDLINFESMNIQSYNVNSILEHNVSVDEIISTTASSFAETCRSKGVALCVSSRTNVIGTFHGSSVKTILMNLIGNAVKFTQKGSITITPVVGEDEKESASATVRIAVNDTGPGIDDAIKDHIFQQYGIRNQGEKFTTSGIGLRICAERIKAIDGTISFKTVLGEGTEFVFVFPITNIVKVKEQAPVVGSTEINRKGKRCNILIAEDSLIIQRIYGIMLGEVHDFKLAFDGQEAIQLLRESLECKKPYDLIMLDYHMPHMSGMECAHIIREIGCDTPIVFVTGEIGHDIRDEIEHISRCDVLMKPVRKNELMDYIQHAIIIATI
jgi:signal transduction histidine kinase/ActR/RegA family two-component response regulator